MLPRACCSTNVGEPHHKDCPTFLAVLENSSAVREFGTGATRSADKGKHDLEGFLSPLVLERFAQYMDKNRIQPDGSTRASDNWQKGIPLDSYMKSAFRHFMSWWANHRKWPASEDLEDALCAVMFNVMGYLHETLKRKRTAGQDVHPDPYDRAPG